MYKLLGIAVLTVLLCLFQGIAFSDVIHIPADQPKIQNGINAADEGDTVLVSPGTYIESINFIGKMIKVISSDGPEVTTIQAPTTGTRSIITTNGGDTAITDIREYRIDSDTAVVAMINGEPKGVELSGFTIRGGGNSGIRCLNSSPTITNNIIIYNFSDDMNEGAGINMFNTSSSLIKGNVIHGNSADVYGAGIHFERSHNDTVCYNLVYDNYGYGDIRTLEANTVIYNNTVFPRTWSGILNQRVGTVNVRNNIVVNSPHYAIQAGHEGTAVADYNCTWNCADGYYTGIDPGAGSIYEDPLIIDPANNIYELQSNSPCLDAGDPNPFFNDENGSRNDMGAFPHLGPFVRVLSVDYGAPSVGDTVFSKTPEINWSYYDSESQIQYQYQIQVGTDEDWTTAEMWDSGPVTTPYSSTTYAGTVLLPSTKYYLRIRINTGSLWSEWYYGWFYAKKTLQIFNINYGPTSNDHEITTLTPEIFWTFYDTEGTTQEQYEIQVSTDQYWNVIDMWDSGPVVSTVTSAVYAGAALSYNTAYYIRIRAYNGFEWTDWVENWFYNPRTFEVRDINFGPTANGNEIVTLIPEFFWTYFDTEGTTQAQYQIQVGTDNDWSVAEMWDSGPVNSTEAYAVYGGSALNYNTNYVVRIRCYDGSDWTGWAMNWFHNPRTYEIRNINYGPTAYYNEITTLIPEFFWTFYDSDGSTQVQYQIQVGTDQNWTVAEMWDSGPVSATESSAIYAGSALEYGVFYLVRIRASNGTEWTDWVENWFYNPRTFEVRDINYGPTANGNEITTLIPEFFWTYFDTEGTTQAQYQIQVGTDSDWSVAEMWDSGPVNSATASATYDGLELAYNTTYFVRIRAFDGIYWTEWQAGWFENPRTFEVRDINYGANSQDYIVTTLIPEFLWTYFDTEGSSQVQYQIQIGSDDDWTTAEMWDSGPVTSSVERAIYDGAVLTAENYYFMRIRVFDGLVWSDWALDSFLIHMVWIIHVPDDYSTIQEAINASVNSDTILVSPGTYNESINYNGKLVVVKSTNGPIGTIITSSNFNNLITFNNFENSHAVLDGFTLAGGYIGILCRNAGPTIRRNILIDQNIGSWAAISMGQTGSITLSAPAIIENNTIVNCANGGISSYSIDPPTIRNNIIAFNEGYAVHNANASNPPYVGYCNIYGNGALFAGANIDSTNIVRDNPNLNPDYSLNANSPCLNAGDPDPKYNDPDGTRNDIGAVPYNYDLPIADQLSIVPDEADYIVYTTTPEISWTYLDTLPTTQYQYQLQVGTDEDWSIAEVWDSGPVTSDENVIVYNGAALDDNQNYFIRVRVNDGTKWGEWTYTRFYTYTGHIVSVPDDFPTIQDGIDIAHEFDTVMVLPGRYVVKLAFNGKTIVLMSEGGMDVTTLQRADFSSPIITVNVPENPTISGFTFEEAGYSGSISVNNYAEISYNRFANNTCAININDDRPQIHHNMFINTGVYGAIVIHSDANIYSNTFDGNRTGINIYYEAYNCQIINNIFTNNEDGIFGAESPYGGLKGYIDYNDIWNDYAPVETYGSHDISADPQYIDPENGNYRLQPTSPCIDAGTPGETDADGTIIDMGAFPRLFVMPYARGFNYNVANIDHYVISLTPAFYWTYFDIDATTQTQYQIQVGTDDDWTVAEMWDSGPVASSAMSSLYEGQPLVDYTDYFLRVRLHDGTDWGEWVPDYFYTHIKPQIFRVPDEYPTIQAGIEAARFFDSVKVAPGVYYDNLDFLGKSIVVTSETGARDTDIRPSNTTKETILFNSGESSDAVLSGFTVKAGINVNTVYCSLDSEPIIENNIFRNNISEYAADFAVIYADGHALIRYNLFYDNKGIGVVYSYNNAEIINNTMVDNENGINSYGPSTVIRNNIITDSKMYGVKGVSAYFEYNDVWNNGAGNEAGTNGLSVNPLFVDADYNDFNLRDASPCIDAGHPGPVYNDINGTRNDMGALPFIFCGDGNLDNQVSIADIVQLINYYFAGGEAPSILYKSDFNCDDVINLVDIVALNSFVLSNGSIQCCYFK